jgi:hypothetical protein
MVLLILGAAGCVTGSYTADGQYWRRNQEPVTLPANLQWCSQESRTLYGRGKTSDPAGECRPEDVFCHQTAQLLAPCIEPLKHESPPQRFLGRVVLGFSSDAEGNLNDVCLLTSDMGETVRTLECVAELARHWKEKVLPNQTAHPWPVSFYLD